LKAYQDVLTIVAAIVTSCLSKDDLLKILRKFLEVFAKPLKELREAILAEMIALTSVGNALTKMQGEQWLKLNNLQG
jgi:hypothetical protein